MADTKEWQSSSELTHEWLDLQRQRHAHPDLYAPRSTGIKTLDKLLGGGIELNQYVLIGGPPKGGKTTLLLSIARAFARQRVPFIWFGAEMTNMQVGTMLFSNISGIERTKIRGLQLEPRDWQYLEAAAAEIENYTGYWNYGFSQVADVKRILAAVEKETGVTIQAIFGDYVQLMEEPRAKNQVQEITWISRGLKRLSVAKGHPMAVIFAAQLNRETVRQKIIDISGWLGGGSLERDMDLGMVIHDAIDPITGQASSNQKEITIVGSRETDTGRLKVLYNGATATIADNVIEAEVKLNYWS